MAVITNREILALAKSDKTYANWTSKLTDEIFTDAGFEDLSTTGDPILADFFGLSVRIVLQKIRRPMPRIPEIYSAIVEEYDNPNGGVFQRINTKNLAPTDPKYRNLVNAGSVDPFVIRKPETEERFFRQNFDFQNFLTIQDIELKKMFLAESGISEYVAGIIAALDESYVIQKYEVMREMVSKALNSTTNPLKDSQKIEVPEITSSSTNADMAKFIQVFHNIYSLMINSVVSSEFNAKSYEHGMYPENYVLLIRADLWNQIKTTLMATTYHTENLGIPFDVIPVKDFGGLSYQDATDSTDLLPVYDDFGAVKGFNKTGSGTVYDLDDLKVVDPNEDIDAVLIQKGAIFTTKQQPYQTRTIYNPAGLYTNFWASQPNASFNYDACYDLVEFYHTTV